MPLTIDELRNLRLLLDRVAVKGPTEALVLSGLARRLEELIAAAQKAPDG